MVDAGTFLKGDAMLKKMKPMFSISGVAVWAIRGGAPRSYRLIAGII
jgi:hypothetical protein